MPDKAMIVESCPVKSVITVSSSASVVSLGYTSSGIYKTRLDNYLCNFLKEEWKEHTEKFN